MLQLLPPELLRQLYRYFDLTSLLVLREVSPLTASYANHRLASKQGLNVKDEYLLARASSGCNKQRIDPQKMALFLRHYVPNLKELCLRGAPLHLSLSAMIQIASSATKVTSLDLRQCSGLPVRDPDYVFGLSYFDSLQVLRLDGAPVKKVDRGCVARDGHIPLSKLTGLETLEFNCQFDTLSRLLTLLRESEIVLHHLRSVEFSFRVVSPSDAEEVIFFLQRHKALNKVTLKRVLLATVDQQSRLYRAVLDLPNLKEVPLEGCTTVGQMDKKVEACFLNELAKRNVTCLAGAQGMRYNADNLS
ncbi:Protein K08B5.2 [Aphelenchoides avenae]|nr:Protein K08B5.2 [Aphelenchus avenae]